MNEGYVKLRRPFLDWEWYGDLVVKAVFLHLILKANYEGKMWRGIAIERGQYLTSISKLSQEISITEQQVKTALKKLKKTGEITSQATSSYTLITVVNYGFHQGGELENALETPTEQPTDNQPPTSHQQASNQPPTSKQLTANHNIRIKRKKRSKEEQEREEVKNIKTYSPFLELDCAIKDFIAFRKTIKAPMGDKAIDLMLSKLDKLSQGNVIVQVEILNQSIMNGWKGIFELKKDFTSTGSGQGNIFFDMAREEGVL